MFSLKKISFFCSLFLCCGLTVVAQVTGTFRVEGDSTKFYPVIFLDGGWNNNAATELEIGRSNMHWDSQWKGTVIAKFRYHVSNWGGGSEFIDADIRQLSTIAPYTKFIAGWRDVSRTGASPNILIWLRGSSSYIYKSNYTVNPTAYDGVQRPLPFQEPGGPAHSIKTTIDSMVNTYGATYGNTMYINGTGNSNYIAGSLGIGMVNTGSHKLAVEGSIGARRVKVTQGTWADFVFHPDYQLPSLMELEHFIKENKHLPEIPSEKEVAQDGLDLGDMNKKLLQKIEELTLYIIDLKKENAQQWEEIRKMRK